MAERLAGWPELELVLAARRPGPLEALHARLVEAGAKAKITVARAERSRTPEHEFSVRFSPARAC